MTRAARPAHRPMGMPLRILAARPWLFGCALLGIAVGFALPSTQPWTTRALLAWDGAVIAYLALISRMMLRADGQTLRLRAQQLDEGRVAILIAGTLVSLVSIGAIVAELGLGKDLHGADKAGHVGLAAATIVLSWFFLHLVFALHYANEFFHELDTDSDHDGDRDLRGGLDFPHTDEPEYVDFLYYAFTIGVAAQTSDVQTTSRTMRAFTLVHSVVAFFFNTVILALTINIAAGLI